MRRLSLAVIVATRGRRRTAARLADHLARQSRAPDRLIFSVADRADAPPGAGEIVVSPPGLAAQRNRGMQTAEGADILMFYDDDFVPALGALAAVERLFRVRPEIAGATGLVLADGVNGDEISDHRAQAICDAWLPAAPEELRVIGLYGCNMAVRAAAARGLDFDEALPLYGWQEDLDFGARLAARGAVIRTTAFAGVHRGLRAARPEETGLGYAQIANPVHLMAGGHIPRGYLLKLMARNLAANHLGALAPGGRADRRGRVRGNWIALADLARGALRPGRAAELQAQNRAPVSATSSA